MQTCLILLPDVTPRELAEAPRLASFSDEIPEGRPIVVLTVEQYGLPERSTA